MRRSPRQRAPGHGFYAISSYSQLDLAGDMGAVSAGWSRMTWDGETAVLRTTSADGNEYAIPSGYEEVTDYLSGRDVPLHLSVFMEGQELKDLLASPDGRAQAVEQIVHEGDGGLSDHRGRTLTAALPSTSRACARARRRTSQPS